jgi:glycosyltransferase involved in cell wall biosynthesis
MELKDKMGTDMACKMRIIQTVNTRGTTRNRNEALKAVKGRWIAFLDAGDVWAPEKLEKQIAFMEEHGYAFSYTNYGLMDKESWNRGVVVSGKAHVTHEDMLKCCWPAYMTVMYDREKVGEMNVRALQNNDYALWLNVSEKADCYLLDENLATMRTKWGRLGGILLTDKLKWRYDAYRYDEGLGRITSLVYTTRNGWYGIVKWRKYVKRGSERYPN